MSNFLNNTTDLEKIYNEVDGINELMTEQDNLIAQIIAALAEKTDSSGGGNTSSTPTLISFTIGINKCQAEEGMTWGEWCNSDYNVNGYTVVMDGYISTPNGDAIIIDSSSHLIRSSDVIIDGEKYFNETPI